jgi:dynamin 1-like protein
LKKFQIKNSLILQKLNQLLIFSKICGKSKNIIDKPIVLTVYSHTCPDLTLVDLPGITRIPMSGSDQPDNIE